MYSTPLVATFDAPNMQQGKMLLSSSPYSFAIGEDYFASCPIGMTSLNNTVKVNGQLVMNLQTSCQCSLSYYQSLKKQEVPIVSYVLLNGTGNTLTIDLNPFNAGVDQRMQNIYMSFYEMAIDDVIIDLKIGNVPTRLDLLSPSSFAQVQTEPFTSTALTNMSNSFSSYVTVNNNAIDVAGNVTFKISSPSSLDNRLIFDLTSIKKINLMTGLSNTVFPQVLNSNTSTQVIYQLIGVNLSYNEQLQIFYTVQTAYEPSSNTKFSLYFSVDGVQSSSQVYEAYASDNTISTTLNVYKTSKMESFFNQYNSGYSLLATVSDLAYFKYVPQIGAMDSKCWIQLNILSQSFNGLIHIFSTKTSKQYSIPVSSSDFITDVSNTAFIVLQSDMIDCINSPTDIYIRVESDFVTQQSFSINIFKKNFLYINDETSSFPQFINATSPNLQNEAYGTFVNSIGTRDNVPQAVYLNFTQFPGKVDAFIQPYNSVTPTGPLLQSSLKKTSLPVKTFLMPGTIIYFYSSCKTCIANLTISLPAEYAVPFILYSDAGSSSITSLPYQYKNDYGIYWTYINVTMLPLTGNATLIVDVFVYNLIKTPPKLTLLATQGPIPLLTTTGSSINVPNNARFSVTTIGNTQIYNSTFDCSQSRSATYATISISVPAATGVWKFGLFIDPNVTKSNTLFAWNAKSSDFNTVISGTSSLSFQRLYVNPVEVVSSFSFSCGSYSCDRNRPAQLLLKFDASTLALNSRAVEIYVKMGSVPTSSSYDFKSRPMSTYNNLTSNFVVRYLFTNVGTFGVNDALGSFSLISSDRLDFKKSTLAFVWIRPTDEISPFVNNTLCSQSSSSTRATYWYWYRATTTTAQADYASGFDFANPLNLNVTGNLTTDNNGKNMLVDLTIPNSYSIFADSYRLMVMVIDSNGNTAIYEMKRTIISYVIANTLYTAIRYSTSFPIASSLIDNPLNTSVMIVPLYNTSTILSSYKYDSNMLAYVEEPAFNVLYYSPIYISIGVMVGISLIVLIYFLMCYLLIWIFNLDYSLDEITSSNDNSRWFNKPLWYPFTWTIALHTIFWTCIPFVQNATLKRKLSTFLFGIGYFLCAIVLSVVLLAFMGQSMNDIDRALHSDPLLNKHDQDLSLASYRSYYACCRFKPSSSQNQFKNDPFYCVTSSTSYSYDYSSYSNITINGVRYDPPMPSRAITTENFGILMSFLGCPNMSVVYYPAGIDAVNAYGISAFVLGGVFSCLCVIAFSALVMEYMIQHCKVRRSVFASWMRTNQAATSVATNSTNLSAVSSSHHTTDDPLQREQAMMREVDQRNVIKTTNTGTSTGAPVPKSTTKSHSTPASVSSSEDEDSSDEDIYDHVHVELPNVVRSVGNSDTTRHPVDSSTIPPDIKKPTVPTQSLESPRPPNNIRTTTPTTSLPHATVENYGHVPLGSVTVIQNNEVYYGMQNMNDPNNLVQVIPPPSTYQTYLPESVVNYNSNTMDRTNQQQDDSHQPAIQYNYSNYNN
nr:unnamed protein product [Naegleria fowleri]